MDRKKTLKKSKHLLETFNSLNELNQRLESGFIKEFNRSLPMADHLNDRWERSKRLGFGTGTNIYDSSYVIGDVKVGKNCWIGMFTILDGSGKLEIGNNCTISAGVHIYSHDNLHSTLTSGKIPVKREKVRIGNNCYLAPYSVISKGVNIGNNSVVAAHSFVNRSFPANSIIAGIPAKQIGKVIKRNGKIEFEYFK